MATVTFLEACGCVTGSSTLLSWGDTSVLVDCNFYPLTGERVPW